jgi:tetratricopeptide (TPR) repeat protein
MRLATDCIFILILAVGLTGCGTDATSSRPAQLTFSKDIAPIIWQHCSGCHRPGEIGPFSLLTYEDVRSHARKIVTATRNHVMPPWLPAPGYGQFLNERRLSGIDVERIEQWVAQGAKEANPADGPPIPKWTEGWQLGTPDLIVELPRPYTVRPGSEDVFRNFVIPIPISTTRYVRAIEVRPGNNKVVHHVTIGVDRTRASRRLDDEDPEPGFAGGMFSESTSSPDNHALGWTPGMGARTEPADMAWRLEAGSDLVLQMHLLPSRAGTDEMVRPSVGFFFTDTPPTRASLDFKLGSKIIDIPAGRPEYTIEDSYTLPVDVDVLSVYPHAHYLAKEMKAFAALPGGPVKWLIWIKDWDFHWQDQYRYATPLSLPRGTVVTMRYTYDNSDQNEHNPAHPPKSVKYGPQSTDEMGDLWLRLVPHTAADFNALARSYMANELGKDITAGEQRTAQNPRDAKWHSFLGARYVEAGRLQQGISELEQAIRLEPSHAEAHSNLGHALRLEGRLADALLHFREAARFAPGNDVVRLNLANALQDAGRLDEAIGQYRLALAINPDAAQTHNDLGTALAARDLLADAVKHFKLALAIRPDYSDAQKNLTQALQLLAGSAR